MSVSSPITSHTKKAGTCPHGLPLGACPICNGMAGGNSTTKRDTPRNIGEMTYNQCLAIGNMLKAQKHAKEQAKLIEQNRLHNLAEFQKNIDIIHQKLMDFSAFLNSKFPPIVAKPMNFVINNIILKALNFVKNLPLNFQNLAQNIISKFIDITDKLNAIYGEVKTAINKKISKAVNHIKKQLKTLFFGFSSNETDEEEQKIEEAKRTFELKTYIQKLFNRNKKEEENATKSVK